MVSIKRLHVSAGYLVQQYALFNKYFVLLLAGLLLGAVICTAVIRKVGYKTGLSARQWNVESFSSAYGNGQTFYYLEYLPPGYWDRPLKKYPMLISLHGLDHGTIGTGFFPNRLKKANLEKTIKLGRDYPFVIVSVHQPTEVKGHYNYSGTYADGSLVRDDSLSWDPNIIDEVMEKAQSELRIDKRRIYILGCSMGAGGVWNYLAEHGDKIAAGVSIAGYYTEEGPYTNNPHINVDSLAALPVNRFCTDKIIQTPVWAFHAADDHYVKPLFSYKLVKAVNDCCTAYDVPPSVRFTMFKEDGHLQIYRKVVQYKENMNYSIVKDTARTGGVTSAPYNPTEEFGNDVFGWLLSHQLPEKKLQPIPANPKGKTE